MIPQQKLTKHSKTWGARNRNINLRTYTKTNVYRKVGGGFAADNPMILTFLYESLWSLASCRQTKKSLLPTVAAGMGRERGKLDKIPCGHYRTKQSNVEWGEPFPYVEWSEPSLLGPHPRWRLIFVARWSCIRWPGKGWYKTYILSYWVILSAIP